MGQILEDIGEVAASIGIPEAALTRYGRHIAKVDPAAALAGGGTPGDLVLVTSMSPTPAGEGKTTLTIGLAQSMKLLGRRAAACLRQPSLGPLLGSKGGATGSGRAGVHPSEEISLMFTGDDAAVTTAHNLVSALIDNHIHHGNPLGIDPWRVSWRRASAIGDRALRRVRVGVGRDGAGGREDGFIISAASEIASILCLSSDIRDMTERVGRVIVGFTGEGAPVTIADIRAAGAVAALLKDALRPNLVQSTEGVPVFIHGGPFGNISIGCNSLIATSTATRLADVVLTEAGFATDLGAEKFFDIVCRAGGLRPAAAVVVATLAALRLHGGAADPYAPGRGAAIAGLANLVRHVENVRGFGVPALVAINRFAGDAPSELASVKDALAGMGMDARVVDVREGGGEGGLGAAEAIAELCFGGGVEPVYAYELDSPIQEKITAVARRVYGAGGVEFSERALSDIEELEGAGLGGLPVCIAKTHASLSDDPALIGAPSGFTVHVRALYPASGAGFIVVLCGRVLLMPGLPAHPRAESMGLDDDGNITGI